MQSKKLTMLSSILSLTLLSGCGTATTEQGVRTVHDICLIDKGISFAPANGRVEDASNKFDTDETVDEIEAHNLRFEAVCPTPEPTPEP